MAKIGLINGYPHWLKTDGSQAQLYLNVDGNLKITYQKRLFDIKTKEF